MSTIAPSPMRPRHVRLDAATACQLKCPACPTASGETGKRLGVGFLTLEDFKSFVDRNPWVSGIELSNWGEIFLNKDLPAICRYAFERNVALYASNGVNLNTANDEALEALVRYKVRHVLCSIDGATPDTYAQYRVRGNLEHVIANIRRINALKVRYRSAHPELTFQFVAFGHNEHEIGQARALAAELGMSFYVKLSWGDLYTPEFSPVRNLPLIRRETGLGVSSRDEYERIFGQVLVERKCCVELWTRPQVNIDGRVLGCSVNYWADYGNAFTDGLEATLNVGPLGYARAMLKGQAPAREGIPCTTCSVYRRLRETRHWIRDEEVVEPYAPSRLRVMLENKYLGFAGTRLLWRIGRHVRNPANAVRGVRRRARQLLTRLTPPRPAPGSLPSGVYPLSIALESDTDGGWKPYPKFAGSTAVAESFTCHSSVLGPDQCPHPPHEHRDEEILMVLSGEATLMLPSLDERGEAGAITLRPGQFVYYPAGFWHTLRASRNGPVNYLMFKWFSRAVDRPTALGFGRHDVAEAFLRMTAGAGFQTQLVVEGATQNLSKLHAHVSVLTPAAGYEPHVDPYDVALVVLAGCVDTLDRQATAHDVAFYPAGTPHGIRNPGTTIAKYLVFEFHR